MIQLKQSRLGRFFSDLAVNRGNQSGYDATYGHGKRRAPSNRLRHEDRQLLPQARRRLVWSGRDLIRNYAVAAWAVRKHLDFVAEHSFHAKTEDTGLNNELEAFIAERSTKEMFDVAGRHSLARYNRIVEARRTVDGDFFTHRLRDGTVAGIEGDRVRSDNAAYGSMAAGPDISETEAVSHGVVFSKRTGKARRYLVYERSAGSGFVFDRELQAQFVHHHAYFDRIDQYRGISPMSSAINTLVDTYESIDYAVARAKVAQIFGMTVYRTGTESAGILDGPHQDTDDDGEADSGYSVDFGKGPVFLDLDPGDRAEFLENKTPAPEFQTFIETLIGITLKSLDLPFSFYNESFTNFNGSRAALILYLKSTQAKRRDVQAFLYEWTTWQLLRAFGTGELQLPRTMAPDQVPFVWYPTGVPFWNPAQELRADIDAISAGLKTRAEVRLERNGDDWFDVVEQLRVEEEKIIDEGINVTLAPASSNEGAASTE